MDWEKISYSCREKSTHKSIIDDICKRNNANTKSWLNDIIIAVSQTLNEPVASGKVDDEVEYDIRNCMNVQIIPDAYKIDISQKLLTLWEVENTSPISKAKMAAVSLLELELDYWGWKVKLITVDRYGNENHGHIVNTPNGFEILSDKSLCAFRK